MSIEALTIHPIKTLDNGAKLLQYTVVEDGEKSTHTYITDTYGEGLWYGDNYLHQLRGTCQFNANGSNRRARFAWFILEGDPGYEMATNNYNFTTAYEYAKSLPKA